VGIEETPAPPTEPALGRLAYVRDGGIWVRELPGRAPQRLTTDGHNVNPQWSPSGEWLLFEREMALWAMRDDGSDVQPLLAPGLPQQVAWSPKEDRLAYITDAGSLVMRAPPGHWPEWGEATPVRNATPERAQQVTRLAWSPDGQWLACEILQYADPGRDTPARQVLRVVRVDGQESADLLVEDNPMETAIRLAGWSGEGTHVLFWRGPVSASTRSDKLIFMGIPVSGGQPQMLAATMLAYEDFVAPHPAASLPALVVGGGREAWHHKPLVVMDVDGQSPRSLSGTSQAVTSPTWSPGGRPSTTHRRPGLSRRAALLVGRR
jgi:hypothetical protein